MAAAKRTSGMRTVFSSVDTKHSKGVCLQGEVSLSTAFFAENCEF